MHGGGVPVRSFTPPAAQPSILNHATWEHPPCVVQDYIWLNTEYVESDYLVLRIYVLKDKEERKGKERKRDKKEKKKRNCQLSKLSKILPKDPVLQAKKTGPTRALLIITCHHASLVATNSREWHRRAWGTVK